MADPIQDAIGEVTLRLATARFASAAARGDRRAMGLAVARADRELEGPKLEAFFTAADLRSASVEALALKRIGAACPELMEKARAKSH